MVPKDGKEPFRKRLVTLAKKQTVAWAVTKRQLCDLQLLLQGAFAPLDGFLCRNDYESVVHTMRLENGALWPIPIALDIDDATAEKINIGEQLMLTNGEGVALATLQVEDKWQPNLTREAEEVYGSVNPFHPGVAYLLEKTKLWYIGGRVEALHPVKDYDFSEIRLSPCEVKDKFKELGWKRIIAFQTRNPMHRVHFELTLRALQNHDAGVLIHPVVGETKPGDVDHYTRVKCYKALMKYYPKDKALLSLLPLAMRMAGPREALWHALIRKNYGCTHFIVGRDHAGPGVDQKGLAFYGHYAAQHLLKKHQEEIGINMVPFEMMQYVKNRDVYVTQNELKADDDVQSISGTEVRACLAEGREIPGWYTFQEITEILRSRYPSKHSQGLTIFFTGLSASGKSTVAQALLARILETTDRKATLLDGDLVRRHLSSELGFSKEHRDLNILRIGYVASEITKHGGIALCSPIAPYDNIRKEVRKMAHSYGA